MCKDSVYSKMLQSGEQRISMGYNYRTNGIMSKWVSPAMFGNPRLNEFLTRLELLFFEILDSVKKVQFFNNYTIDKNDTRYNQ